MLVQLILAALVFGALVGYLAAKFPLPHRTSNSTPKQRFVFAFILGVLIVAATIIIPYLRAAPQ